MTRTTAYLQNRLLSADPIELVDILYEYAILRVQQARTHLALHEIALRAEAISKAIAILGELETSLDHTRGGEIAGNLAKLYQYMRTRLLVANARQQAAPLEEVEKLLTTLHEAWQEIRSNGVNASAYVPEPTMTTFSYAAGLTAVDYGMHAWSA